MPKLPNTPIAKAIAKLIEGKEKAATETGKNMPLTITYHPATESSPARIHYGRPAWVSEIRTAESVAVSEAVRFFCPQAKKLGKAQLTSVKNETWWVAKWELPTLDQQSLLTPKE